MSIHHAQVRRFRARPAAMAVGLVLALTLLSFGMASAYPAGGPTADTSGPAGPLTPRQYLPALMKAVVPATAYRLGFDRAHNLLAAYPELGSFGAGWYQDWGYHVQPDLLPGMKFVQTIRLHQKLACGLWQPNSYNRTACPYLDGYEGPDPSEIRRAVAANPGSTWIIGNEIERRDWCNRYNGASCLETVGQDEILPEVYVVAYHELYQLIKATDPTALVGVGSLVEITPLRLQYMTMVFDAYRARYGQAMPTDFWNIHTFVLPEVHNQWGADIPAGLDFNDPAILAQAFHDDGSRHLDLSLIDKQVRDLRSWIKAREQKEGLAAGMLQNKDLINTEYGVLLLSYNQQQVQDYMIGTFNLFLNTKDCTIGNQTDDCRLMQSWGWYSLDDDDFNVYGNLFDPNTHAITRTGQVYRDYLRAHLNELTR